MSKTESKAVPGPEEKPQNLFLNRELSWLEFNERVLQEGLSAEVPLLERLKFLAIVGSNLDEFLMIRVAGLKQQAVAGVTSRDIAGMTPEEQLAAIRTRVRKMVADQAAGIRTVLAELAGQGLSLVDGSALSAAQRAFLDRHFESEVLPVLTPLAVGELAPFPRLPGSNLNVGAVLEPLAGVPGAGAPAPEAGAGADVNAGAGGAPAFRLAVVPVPECLARFVRLPGQRTVELARVEEEIAARLGRLFPEHRVAATAFFRLIRDADVRIDDDDAADLLSVVEGAVRKRRRRAVVRLELSAGADPRLRKWLLEWCEVDEDQVLEVDGTLGSAALMELATRGGFESLRNPDWLPREPRDLAGSDDLWAALRDRDALLFHPYESFEPVERLLELAAEDPGVLAVKGTLYRTDSRSRVVAALERAAEHGKQVTVLVELKARFDEARNVSWARRLEAAGCQVIYGVAGFKTHGKVLLVIRREADRIRRYVHLSTGNYNARTARLYSDIGLMTSDPGTAADAAAFFNLLTGYSQAVDWKRFAVSPKGIRQRLLELIQREVEASTPDQPGLIMIKVNSLQDEETCLALYCASQAGVRVLLNVRGVCCLRPGLKGTSENIEVVSIIDRFLEHARVFFFRNGGSEEIYLSSADLMTRNLDKRLEILFPVTGAEHRRRLVAALEAYFADNVKAWRLLPDGCYRRRTGRGRKVRAQEQLYEEASAAAKAAAASEAQFRPLTKPQDGS